MPPKASPADEMALVTFLHTPAIKDDLYNFVMAAYPWGKKGSVLEHYDGPKVWHKQDLKDMSDHILSNQRRMSQGKPPIMWKSATAAGRGPGKSARMAWLANWMPTTRIGSTTIIAANTEAQLKSRTFAEISKWTNLLINNHWFEQSVLSIRPAPWFAKLVKDQLGIDTGYYYVQGQLWSEENPDAFAGVHNPLGMFLGFDEASGIPTSIFNVSSFFFTEPTLDRYWVVQSNPRRNSGGFYECFHATNTDWRLRHIDIRTVEGMDQGLIEKEVEKHGIDSDVVRMEILGQFPKQGNKQFIGNDLVRGAQHREVEVDLGAPLILGVDIARQGDDESVFRFRRGRDARTIPAIRHKNRDNMFIANELAKVIDHYKPDAVNIDMGGGAGVIDRLREMGYKVFEVKFGDTSSSPEWAFKRTEMWADMRDWLGGGGIDLDPRLFGDLTAPECKPYGKAGDQTILQSKEEMRGLGYRSPDDGDALAMTFARKVARKDFTGSRSHNRVRQARDLDYNVFTVN